MSSASHWLQVLQNTDNEANTRHGQANSAAAAGPACAPVRATAHVHAPRLRTLCCGFQANVRGGLTHPKLLPSTKIAPRSFSRLQTAQNAELGRCTLHNQKECSHPSKKIRLVRLNPESCKAQSCNIHGNHFIQSIRPQSCCLQKDTALQTCQCE